MQLKTALMLSTLALSGAVLAQTKAPEPDYTLSFNAGVVSDYRYRGISQTRLKPAVQAGADLGHSSGLYLGTWATNIKWIKDSGATDGSIELDIYGGYKGTAGDIGYDVGFLRYEYVGNKLGNVPGFANANTNELYAAVTVGPFTAKYSHSVSNLFGYLDSKNSQYLDINATFDLGGGWTVTPHVGRQVIKNNEAYNYTDYSVTLGKDLGNGLSASLMLVDTTAKEALYTWGGKYVGKEALVAGLKYTF